MTNNYCVLPDPVRGLSSPKSLLDPLLQEDPDKWMYLEKTVCWQCRNVVTYHAIHDVTWRPHSYHKSKEVAEVRCPCCQAKIPVGYPRTTHR